MKVVCTSVGRRFSRRMTHVNWVTLSRGCNPSYWAANIKAGNAAKILAESEPGWLNPGFFVPTPTLYSILMWGAWEFFYAEMRGYGIEISKTALILSVLFDIAQWFVLTGLFKVPYLGILVGAAGKCFFSRNRRLVFRTYLHALTQRRAVALCRDLHGFYVLDLDPRSPAYRHVIAQDGVHTWPATEKSAPHKFVDAEHQTNIYQNQPWTLMHPDSKEVWDIRSEKYPGIKADTPIIRRYNPEKDIHEAIDTRTGEVVHTYHEHEVVRATKGWKFICMVYGRK